MKKHLYIEKMYFRNSISNSIWSNIQQILKTIMSTKHNNQEKWHGNNGFNTQKLFFWWNNNYLYLRKNVHAGLFCVGLLSEKFG